MKIKSVFISAFVFVLALSTFVSAQTINGNITGTVLDP